MQLVVVAVPVVIELEQHLLADPARQLFKLEAVAVVVMVDLAEALDLQELLLISAPLLHLQVVAKEELKMLVVEMVVLVEEDVDLKVEEVVILHQ